MVRAFFLSCLLHTVLLLSFYEPFLAQIEISGGGRTKASLNLAVIQDKGRETQYPISGPMPSVTRVPEHKSVNSNHRTPSVSEQPAIAAQRGQASVRDSLPDSSLSDTEAIVGDLLRAYRLALARELARLRQGGEWRLPHECQGRVLLVADVMSGRGLPKAFVEHPSGVPEFDNVAVRMLEKVLHEVPIPQSLSGRKFRLPLSIECGPFNTSE